MQSELYLLEGIAHGFDARLKRGDAAFDPIEKGVDFLVKYIVGRPDAWVLLAVLLPMLVTDAFMRIVRCCTPKRFIAAEMLERYRIGSDKGESQLSVSLNKKESAKSDSNFARDRAWEELFSDS